MPDSPPALSVAAAARRLGVAPDTLRTWDRRYGLGPSERTAGARRRYSPNDVARLEVMRRLTQQGFPAQEAARAALRLMMPVPSELSERPDQGEPASPGRQAAPSTGRGLMRAALALDAAGMSVIVEQEIERRGVVPTWDGLVVPVLNAVGYRWEVRGQGVEIEHLLSETVLACLRDATRRLRGQDSPAPLNSRPVLAACTAAEEHSLPLFALAAALAERQVEVRVLGARVPEQALTAAVRRCGPAAVLVWSQDRSAGCAKSLSKLVAVRPSPVVLAGGPGWQDPLPGCVRRVDSLAEAVEAVLRAVGV